MVLISVLLLIGQHWASAQRPVGDTIIGADSTYMYYIYDWWRCANHEAEAPRWYTVTSGLLFGWAYKNNSIVRGAYSGPLGDPGGSHSAYEYAAGNDIRGLQMVTDRPIKIMGMRRVRTHSNRVTRPFQCGYMSCIQGLLYHLIPHTSSPACAIRRWRDGTRTHYCC